MIIITTTTIMKKYTTNQTNSINFIHIITKKKTNHIIQATLHVTALLLPLNLLHLHLHLLKATTPFTTTTNHIPNIKAL
jgi:hypothetical protein